MNSKGYIKNVDLNEYHQNDLKLTEYIIYCYIKGFPQGLYASKTYIADCFKIKRSTLYKYLDKLNKLGLIEETKINGKVMYMSKNIQNECTENEQSSIKNEQSMFKKGTPTAQKRHTNNNIYNNNYNYFYNKTNTKNNKKEEEFELDEITLRAINDPLIFKKKNNK